MMKKVLIIFGMLFFLVGCGNGNSKNAQAEFSTQEAEQLLNKGEDLEGKTVEFTVDKLAPTSAFGYNLQTGEHLNFVSAENPKVKEQETIIAEIENVKSVAGSFIIEYKIIENKGIMEDSSKSKTEKSTANEKVASTFNPADYNAAMPTDEFIRDPEANKGKKTKFVARILQEISTDEEIGHFYLATVSPEKNKNVTVQIFVSDEDFHTKILEDDEVRTYVTFVDSFKYETVNGVNKEVPSFYMDNYEVLK